MRTDPPVTPASDMRVVEFLRSEIRVSQPLPFFDVPVSAGFPSPAEDTQDIRLDLNDLLVKHPEATFFVRVQGESMLGAGIHSGDILVVDRSLEAGDGAIVVAVVDGEFTVKRLNYIGGRRVRLVPENAAFPALDITPDHAFQVWGVVTGVVRNFLSNGRIRA